MDKTNHLSSRKKNKIFISWSGTNSKEIAKGIKEILQHDIFKNKGLECFVSDLNIMSGTDWWKKINKELRTCKMGIICITKDNINEPWIYFEAGAMIAREIPTIPLLINCGFKHLASTPLLGKQATDFYDQQKFVKMVLDINETMKLIDIEPADMSIIAKNGYEKLKDNLKDILTQLKDYRVFDTSYVYPATISTVRKNTIFISVPMAAVEESEYKELREKIIDIKSVLEKIGFSDIICPMLEKENKNVFDGKAKATKENFSNLKQVDSMLIIYPKLTPSSVLVETGYGVALTKKMVIFYNEELPFILDKAGENIHHVKTCKYSSLDEISNILESNGMALFEDYNNE